MRPSSCRTPPASSVQTESCRDDDAGRLGRRILAPRRRGGCRRAGRPAARPRRDPVGRPARGLDLPGAPSRVARHLARPRARRRPGVPRRARPRRRGRRRSTSSSSRRSSARTLGMRVARPRDHRLSATRRRALRALAAHARLPRCRLATLGLGFLWIGLRPREARAARLARRDLRDQAPPRERERR